MSNNYQILISKLDGFIRKYYKNRLLKGAIYSIGLSLGAFILFTSLEYFGQFNTLGRTILFYAFVVTISYLLVSFIVIPLTKLYNLGKVIDHKQAAKIIGNHFDEVKDKLINVLQLEHLSEVKNNNLLIASIDQKSMELKPIPFTQAVDFGENKKHLKYLIIPFLLMLGIIIIAPGVFTEGTQRLVNHNVYIAPKAPFNINILNDELSVLKNKDFDLQVEVSGNQLPEKLYIEQEGNRSILSRKNKREYSYAFRNVQKEKKFRVYASGFYSKEYKLNVVPNPILIGFSVDIEYPNYVSKQNETLTNLGDLVLPEGTRLRWDIKTEDAESLNLIFGDSTYRLKPREEQVSFSLQALKSQSYAFVPLNSFVASNDTVSYSLQVIPDRYPAIVAEEKRDSIDENRVYFKGQITDDYGFSGLRFNYRITTEIDSLGDRNELKSKELPFTKTATADEFFLFWNVSDLNALPGDEIEYYFEVWDNDGVNGRKSTKTSLKTFKSKSIEERNAEASKSNEGIKKNLIESIEDAKQIKEDVEALKKKLSEKKEVSWEEKQKMKDLLEKQKELEKKVNEIQLENQKNNDKQNEYNNYSEEILQKQEQIQKLFDELMSDEMKEMMKKLQEMMDKLDKNMFENELEKMDMSNQELEKELDRSLELFKQMEFEQKLDEVKNKLEKLAQDQEELSKDTRSKEESNEQLEKRQEELNKEFDKVREELSKLEKMDEELESPNGMENTKEEQEEVANEMENSSNQIKNQKNKKASESQKKAAQKMSEMAQKMDALQQQMQSSAEDMDALRQLLDNLLHLSFKQEDLMERYKGMNRKDPGYVQTAQEQKKLKDDAKMIEDSLFALSKRVVQLESTINKEISRINNNMEKAIEFMAERQMPQASSRQQYVMTSINNLALLFDEALQQMQQAQQKSGEGSCNKPGGNGQPKPGFGTLKQMQKKLNEQMEAMKRALEKGKMPGGKKPGEKNGGLPMNGGMSKSLAKMAAQQAKIREELNKLKDGKNGSGKNGLSKLMEQNETDIVNKRITQETINRQQEILTRLLESEKASREREWDDKRESKEGMKKDKVSPTDYFTKDQEYDQEVDLLNTTPPDLRIFYKKKVALYFQNINQ